MSGKYALIIANTEYNDASLAQLTAPGRDAEDFARVLRDKDIGAFDDVKILLNNPEPQVREAVDEFFDQKKHDDLLVLYFSGHGVRDEMGSLYLALKNTTRARLRATALKSDFIREMMDQTHSKRVVLILDCCNSGAFAQGTKAMTGGSVGTASAFEGTGYGRIVLTASDSTQFAWEGDKVIGGDTQNSLFTHFLVKGLEGEADHDFDGRITVDELFDYAYEQIVTHTPKQTPGKWSYKQQGEIFLRQSAHTGNIKPVSLPDELLEAIDDTRTFVREGAVGQLEKLAKGKNLGLARVAREALDKIAKEDDSHRVAQIAAQALEAIRQAEQIAAQKAEEERLARVEAEKKAEEERLARAKIEAEKKAEAERKAKEEAQRLAAQKAEEERLARVKMEAEMERKEKEEAQRLVAQKAEEEQLALEKAEVERKAKEEAQRLAAQKAEEERMERERIEAERKAKEEAQRLAVKKVAETDKSPAANQVKKEIKNKSKQSRTLYKILIPVIIISVGAIVCVAGTWLIGLTKSTLSSLGSTPTHISSATPDAIAPTIAPSGSEKFVILTYKDSVDKKKNSVNNVAFSQDGKLIAASFISVDSEVMLWDAQTGSLIHKFYNDLFAFSPDGSTIATGNDFHTLTVWSMSDYTQVNTFDFTNMLWEITYSPDGQTIAGSGYYDDGYTIELRRVSDGALINTISGFPYVISSIAFSPDGQNLATSSSSGVKLWQVSNGSLIWTTTNPGANNLAFSPDGQKLAGASALWQVSTGSLIKSFDIGGRVAFSPDGKTIAISDDHTVKLVQIDNGVLLKELEGPTDSIYSINFSPDGKLIAAGDDAGAIHIWDVSP
jgi:TolA protein